MRSRSASNMVRWPSVLVAIVVLAAACTEDNADTGVTTADTVTPIETEPVPGACDEEAEKLEPPTIVIDGESTEATLGMASWNCGTLTGEGFVTFLYNPVLLDASGPVEVRVPGTAEVELAWPGGEPFTERDDDAWRSGEPVDGCTRLIISLESPSGRSSAIYGADIRVGGEDAPCPQRELDPTDPDITDPYDTSPVTSTTDDEPEPQGSSTTTATPRTTTSVPEPDRNIPESTLN